MADGIQMTMAVQITCSACNVAAVYDADYGAWCCPVCRGVLLTDKEIFLSPKWRNASSTP